MEEVLWRKKIFEDSFKRKEECEEKIEIWSTTQKASKIRKETKKD